MLYEIKFSVHLIINLIHNVMAKSRFLKPGKQVKKDIGKSFLNSAVSGGGFLGAKILTNKFGPKITNEKMRRVLGPVKYLLGTVGEAFSAQPQMAALCRGIAVSGIDTSADDFIPVDMKSKLALSGVGAATKEVDGGKGFDWDAAMKKAEEEIAVEKETAAAAQQAADDAQQSVDGLNDDVEEIDYENAM